MKRKIHFILLYFASASLLGYLSVLTLTLIIEKPEIVKEAIIVLKQLSGHEKLIEHSIEEDISANFPDWIGTNNQDLPLQGIHIGNHTFDTLTQASSVLKDGETLIIGAGTYTHPIVIRANDITVIGNGHVIIENAVAEDKSAIITKGNNTIIANIECRNIKVGDGNGACVRHEGTNITLRHVYFHNSQQGILTGPKPGTVMIEDSRFQELGKNGQAHGAYIGGGELIINNSLFLAAKSEGHEIKSRAAITRITGSTIASLSSIDSRLIDISDGGILEISNSVLQQGPMSANGDMIGYALENEKHAINKIIFSNNIFILERNGMNTLLHQKNKNTDSYFKNNIVISDQEPEISGFNLFFKSRKEAGLQPYPFLPKKDKNIL